MACAFSVISKKRLPNPRSGSFSPIFSSKSFIVDALTFRLIYLKNICLFILFGCVRS